MATITKLVSDGLLVKIDPQLEPNEQEHRLVYALSDLEPKLATDLPTWVSQWDVEETPEQQLDALLEQFCSGEELVFDRRFKPLTHLADGIWELKTGDLRLIGWFPCKDIFITAIIDTAFRVKNYGLYPGYCRSAASIRDSAPLNALGFIAGVDPNDVVSNFSYP